MSREPDALAAICRTWMAAGPLAVVPHEPQGLSGAAVFAVTGSAGDFILKPFGPQTTRAQAEWVHALMRHCNAAGVAETPQVACRDDGTTLCETGGRLWELVARVAGEAVLRPTPTQAIAAARSLARIHLAAATLPGDPPRPGHSPGMHRRVAQARDLLARPWAGRDKGIGPAAVRERLRHAASIAAGERAIGIARAAAAEPPCMLLQPVLRDVWSEHVLFDGDRVAGVIDWHAAGIDTPATDIARLVGSWGLDRAMQEAFLAAYDAERPLTAGEREAIPFLRTAGVVCAVDNWFRWILDEGRTFPDMPRVVARLDGLLAALPAALDELAAVGGERRIEID